MEDWHFNPKLNFNQVWHGFYYWNCCHFDEAHVKAIQINEIKLIKKSHFEDMVSWVYEFYDFKNPKK